MTRKRRRQEAFEEPEFEADPVQTEEETAKAREEKEQEIWDAVREAHYEAIEQLPLTLQRQLSLMRQLDEQASSCVAQILPALHKYIELRRRLAGSTGDLLQPSEDTSPPTTGFTQPSGKGKAETSKDMAQQIALLTEEILRASQEKVNIAQTNCDSVERHIQLLDQAIKEQEAALSSDKPVHIHLPELVIPQWRPKPAQSTLTVDPNMDQISEDQNPVDVVGDYPTERRTSKRKGKDGKKGKQQDESASLTITLPAPQPSDEPELLYCYCNRVSFGEMIACDNSDCEREWFHYGCVGLLEPPEGEWFCEDCRLRQDDI